jgi:hypothetical protein
MVRFILRTGDFQEAVEVGLQHRNGLAIGDRNTLVCARNVKWSVEDLLLIYSQPADKYPQPLDAGPMEFLAKN